MIKYPVITHQVVNSVFRSCSYVMTHDNRTWLVDCGDVDQILPLVSGDLCGVLITHEHFDHIYGLNSLLELYPKVPIYTNEAGKLGLMSDKLNLSRYWESPIVLNDPDVVTVIEDGESLTLFDGIKVQALFTPGHSDGCITWLLDDMVFTGDSYIPGVKTVTNLPHSDKKMAYQSEMLIRRLTERRSIYPGHASELETIN